MKGTVEVLLDLTAPDVRTHDDPGNCRCRRFGATDHVRHARRHRALLSPVAPETAAELAVQQITSCDHVDGCGRGCGLPIAFGYVQDNDGGVDHH